MKAAWSLRNMYLYVVCLVTLIMVIVATVGVVRGVAELLYPDPTAYYSEPMPPAEAGADAPDPEELARLEESERESQRRWSILDLVGNAAMLLVAGPIYLYHWRKIESEPSAGTPSEPGPASV
ncbi:MAG: hypothetical protein Kow0056_01510 [Coriobacteriia bacterium]